MSESSHTRDAVGKAIHDHRKSRDMSVEDASKAGGIGHMTWRKIERGGAVRGHSYYAVDRAFGWPEGHTRGVIAADDPSRELAPEVEADESISDDSATTPAIVRYLAQVRSGKVRDDDRQRGRDRTYADPVTGKPVLDTSFRFHHEYDLVLDLLDSLNLSELRGIEHACTRLVNEKQQELNAIHTELFAGSELKTGDVEVHALPADVQAEFNTTYSRYLHTYSRLMELRVHVNELTNQRVTELGDLGALRDEARNLRARLDHTAGDISDLIAQHAQANTEEQ